MSNPARPVIKLHTIAQWNELDESIRSIILQNIKLKDRLQRYLHSLNDVKHSISTAHWVKCSRCADSAFPGFILDEPRYDGIHPSAMGHPCLKKIYYEMVGAMKVEHVEPKLRLIFDLGHAIHHMFQTYGKNGAWGPKYEAEVAVSSESHELADELMIEGHADAENFLLITDIPNSPYDYEVGVVHEYKSMNHDAFVKLTRPKPEHKQQAMIYSAVLDRPVTVFLYLDKNTQDMADFPVAFDPELWSVLKNKAQTLISYYDRREPPKGDVGYHCRDCGFKGICPDYIAAQPNKR